jgi:rRNA-processing protein FCF1
MLFQFRLNLETELDRILGVYNIIIPSVVIRELKNLTETVPEAKTALKLTEKYEVYQVESGNDKKITDDIILDLAQELNAIVVTNDKALRRNLKSNRLSSIYLKSRSHLELD